VEAQDALLKGYLLKLTNSFMNPLVSLFAYFRLLFNQPLLQWLAGAGKCVFFWGGEFWSE